MAAVVVLAGSVVGAVALIFGKLGIGRRRLRARVTGWLNETVGDVVEARLTGRNGGTSLMDSVDRIELEIRGLHASQGELSDRVERLQSDLAVLRKLADERGHDAENRTDSIERRIDTLTEALLHVAPGRTPLYRPDQ